ncbi:MAG TPA: ribosome maturation factor RimP [Gammaproteobacteria bacterium]|nr:ribosome maturation factor RimP [Gammaproteobacteria bacterium]
MARRSDEQLTQLLQPAVEMLGYELLGIEYFSSGNRHTLRIYIDKEGGITVEDCERVSRQVSSLLDVEDPIKGHYTLEVSSPGLDRPLFTAAHFVRFSGSRVKLRTFAPLNGRRNFQGILHGMQDGRVELEVDGEQVLLPLEDIEKARIVPGM